MKRLGLKSGIEIHQQLDTGKLFSRCQSRLVSTNPDFIVKRRLRALAGEMGVVDIAAVYAAEKGLNYFYEVHNNNTSLVELDEEPPELINEEALEIISSVPLIIVSFTPRTIVFMLSSSAGTLKITCLAPFFI